MLFGKWHERYILEIRSQIEQCFFNVTRTIDFGNFNKTRMNSFLEMGKSSSNVPNVFEGSPLTGHSGC